MRGGAVASRVHGPGSLTWILVSLTALGLVWILAMGMAVEAQGAGVIEGRVVNGTQDGPEAGAGLTVFLHVLQGDAEVEVLQAATDDDGAFGFEELDTSADLEYWPEVVYQGVSYSPDEPFGFGGSEAVLDATLTVFETTGDDSGVRLNNVHIIAESFEQVLRLSEIYFVGNSLDRTYAGTGEVGDSGTVFFPLPSNAVGISSGEGSEDDRFLEVDGGLQDTEPVSPGSDTSLAFFSYHLMVSGETVPLERSFAYPVDNLSLLVAQPGLELASDQLLSMGQENFQGQQYEVYVAQGLEAGAAIDIELLPVEGALGGSGMPSAPAEAGSAPAGGATRGNQSLLLWLGLALAGLAIVGAVVYPFATKGPARMPPAPSTLATSPESRSMLVELADLEDALEAGQLEETEYERRRAELFEKLRAQ